MFWTHDGRAGRRQKVLDELMDLDPAARRSHLETAVAAGDVRESEVESALLLVHRLDVVRVMTVPSSGRLPGGVIPITEHHLGAKAAAAGEVARAARQRHSIAIAADTTESPERRVAWEMAVRTTRSGAHSSRRRRMKVVATAGRPLAATAGRVPIAPRV
jgi:hypothetical protein